MTTCQVKSWIDLQGKITGKRLEVLNALKEKPMTLNEICEFLGWAINCVSGRVSELRKMGVIEIAGGKINPASGKSVTVWAVKQLDLF